MSNDEQAWYAATEPAETARLRVGTVLPASVPVEPRQQAAPAEEQGWISPEPYQQAEATPLRPFEQAESARIAPEAFQRDVAASPLRPFEREVAASPLRPFEREVAATPVQPFEREVAASPLRPFERDVAATTVEPFEGAETPRITARGLGRSEPAVAAKPMERGTPAEHATAPSAARGKSDTAAANRISSRPASVNRDASGSAGQGFQVDPAQYQAAVSPMLAVAEQVGSLYASLSSYLPSLESQNPWGNDESGKQFAEGEKGYLKYSKDTLDVIKGLPAALKGIADGLKAMADGYQSADDGVITELNGVDPGSAPMPASPQQAATAPMRITPRIYQSGRH
ncbi:hypothetical protein [Kitasatospora sp. NPDC048407]|uniref:hypothetical protein n=1 Tax=Kitasatospora sp. NPDC048407 TaxID=3364051 RepID=UPI003713F21A